VRRQLSAPYGQPPISRRVGLALFPGDMCGGSCRHPTGSRQLAAELAWRSSQATCAAACVGTLRAAATLPPSWIGALPKRQMRRQLSAPYGQPPISRRVGLALFPSDMCGGSCRHPTGSRQLAAELALRSSIATCAAACVGTLRAAAALPPNWLC